MRPPLAEAEAASVDQAKSFFFFGADFSCPATEASGNHHFPRGHYTLCNCIFQKSNFLSMYRKLPP